MNFAHLSITTVTNYSTMKH